MERLAVQKYGTLFMKYADCEYRSPCFGCESINRCNPEKMACSSYKALKKLAEYEELEEQGKLLKLPCAVGDTVYSFSMGKVFVFHVGSFTAHIDGIDARLVSDMDEYKFLSADMNISDFGKKWFLTREEAKAALKELDG